jgi:hypothetical protein
VESLGKQPRGHGIEFGPASYRCCRLWQGTVFGYTKEHWERSRGGGHYGRPMVSMLPLGRGAPIVQRAAEFAQVGVLQGDLGVVKESVE